jgi:tetratricopeptide (TPR) repeat protein
MNNNYKKYTLSSLAVILLIAVSACSTKKNTTVSRAFHNVTAKYNFYFNANESYKKAITTVSANYTYNYTTKLPVLLVGKPEVASNVGGDMDRAVTKCTELIRHHSITVKPERKQGSMTKRDKDFYNQSEFVHWTREAWLLVGKARIWKGEVAEAAQTFEYIILQFPNTSMWYESQVWLAQIDIIRNDFISAGDRLREISANRKYPKGKYYTHLLSSTWAEFYQRQGQTQAMLPHLTKALKNAPDKWSKLRYTYLLAQVHSEAGSPQEAVKLFSKVIRKSSSYEMSFNARLQMASLSLTTGKGKDFKRQLIKMTKDEKNKDYLDQIYYSLGAIEQREGNIEKAIEYYTLSAKSSVSNNNQKGLSYLTLANYFFAKPNYRISQSYYDSAYNALDNTHPEYAILEVKTANLNKLVENLTVIQTEDSLQRIAKLSSRERDVIIAQLIAKVREEEAKAKQEEQEDRNRFNQFQQGQRSNLNQPQGTGWYFYNQSALSYGQSEFRMRWGQRKLEDNWRRKNKRVVMQDEQLAGQTETDSTGVPKKPIDNKSREFYLQDLPLNDSLIAISNQKIEQSMLQVAEVYEKKLKDFPEAIKAYDIFTTRFPRSMYSPEVYYNAYQLNLQQGNSAQAERSKQALISNFPNSRFALMLTNPNFLSELNQKQKEQEQFYQKVFELYKTNKCSEAILEGRRGISTYKGSEIEPKLHLLVALCTGKTTNLQTYRESLSYVVKQFANTPEASAASDILKILSERELQLTSTVSTDAVKPIDEVVTPTAKYLAPEGEHLFIAVIPKKSPINQLKFNIISFNVDNFLLINLNVGNRELNENFDIITVEGFKKPEEAWGYYQKAMVEEGLMGSILQTDYSMFIISRANFQIFTNEKSVAEYLGFFRATYK